MVSAANKSMESLQILQWCQEFDLPRPAINEGLDCYKEGSRFLPNKDAQIEIPKWSALVVRMRELQEQYKLLKEKEEKDLTEEEGVRCNEIKAEWARLKPEHEDLVERISKKRDQFDMCKNYRRSSQDLRAKAEAAEDARLAQQTGILGASVAGTEFAPVHFNLGQQRVGTPDNSPFSSSLQVNKRTHVNGENTSPPAPR